MSKYIKYFLIFISGAIMYQIALIALTGTWNYKPDEKAYGVSDSYVRERFKDVCEFLESKNCNCYPVVHTDLSCQSDLDEYLIGKTLSNKHQ